MKRVLHFLIKIIGICLIAVNLQVQACSTVFTSPVDLCQNSSTTQSVGTSTAHPGTSVQITNGPTHGSIATLLSPTNGFTYIYNPTTGFNGTDSFFFNLIAGPCNVTGTVNLTIGVVPIFSYVNPA